MNSTSLHIKIDAEIKEQAQQTAQELGLSLSAVMKALLKQFIRTKHLSVGVAEIPNISLRRSLQQADEDIQAGKTMSFADKKAVIGYLDSLIAHDKQQQ